MIDRNEWIEILESLSKNKVRTLLTAFGIFWGIFMLIILLGAGNGLQNGVFNAFKGYNMSGNYVWSYKTNIPYMGLKANRRINFTNDDINVLKRRFGNKLPYISPRSQLSAQEVSFKNEHFNYTIKGLTYDMSFIKSVKINEGRYISPLDQEKFRQVAVIGKEVKNKFFKDISPIGQMIKIGKSFYTIVGVFQSLAEAEQAQNDNKEIYIPISTYQKAFNQGMKVGMIIYVANDLETETEVMSTLRQLHKVSPDDKDAINSWSTRETFKTMQGLFSAIRLLMWIVGVGTLLSGIVGVSNIMVINIKERTKEIGIRKAIGATPFSIVKTIVLESVFLTGLSGYIGLSLGLLLIEGVNYGLNSAGAKSEFFLNPEVNVFVVITAILILLIAGFFAAFMPARKAAMIRPIEALRDE